MNGAPDFLWLIEEKQQQQQIQGFFASLRMTT